MPKGQKTYTQEFKHEAVRLAQTSGKSITQVARDLGISDTSIHQWRKELDEHATEAFQGVGIRRPSRRKIVVSNEKTTYYARSVIS